MDRARADAGRALRKVVPRSAHAAWAPGAGRSPLALLEAFNRHRVPELLTIRTARMRASPFAFYRGAPGVMAHDLATTPTTGITVQACGDAHLLNFGLFATPERNLVFGLNDFDETLPGPWEWDVKRLATSFVVAARTVGFQQALGRRAARAAVRTYREQLAATRGCGCWRCGTRGWTRPPSSPCPGGGAGGRWPPGWPRPSITPTWTPCPG